MPIFGRKNYNLGENRMTTVTAKAHANIALVKYWGKRDEKLNLPAVGSISMTLDALTTTTIVQFADERESDFISIDNKPASPGEQSRTSQFVDLFRNQSGIRRFLQIDSTNNFPTGAGLASSASGFAALTVALNELFNLNLSRRELSVYARMGSGSAARSIFGGFVEMHRGTREDGTDSFAEQLYPETYWPLEMFVLVTSEAAKPIGSTEGMNLTAATSPFYPAWIHASEKDLAEMRDALRKKDFDKLGEIAEFSCFKMHGLALSANPAILYWNEDTVKLIHQIRSLRKQGHRIYLTMDAGPQVKVLCQPQDSTKLNPILSSLDGVQRVLHSTIGGDAKIL
jgi:diphosphomevalonate decarboxylase